MIKYTLKRILQSVITLFIIVSVVFLLMRLMPTDYFFTEDELIKLSEQQKQDKLRAAGLLDSPFTQLARFYGNMFAVDYIYYENQTQALSEKLAEGALAGLHAAVENTVRAFYTDASAAEKEIAKMNEKVLTASVVLKLTGEALNNTDLSDAPAFIEYLTDAGANKALATLLKDAKKANGEQIAGAFTESFRAELSSQLTTRLGENAPGAGDEGFFAFLRRLNPANYRFTFNLGTSYRIQHGVSVISIIMEKFPLSMALGLCSLGLALILGVVLGILQARYKGGMLDSAGTAYTIFVNAVPHLVSYTLIMYACTKLFGLPMTFRAATPVQSAIPPILCLAMGSTASYMLWMRRYMVDELNKDYLRLAQLKGLSSTQVLFRHVMKNAFLPLAQYLPYNILLTVGGSLLAESFFSVPGMGPLLTLAISRYDTSLVQAIVLFYAAMGILGTFLGDLFMGILDPRISLTKKGGAR